MMTEQQEQERDPLDDLFVTDAEFLKMRNRVASRKLTEQLLNLTETERAEIMRWWREGWDARLQQEWNAAVEAAAEIVGKQTATKILGLRKSVASPVDMLRVPREQRHTSTMFAIPWNRKDDTEYPSVFDAGAFVLLANINTVDRIQLDIDKAEIREVQVTIEPIEQEIK